jgi:hypothetical protein
MSFESPMAEDQRPAIQKRLIGHFTRRVRQGLECFRERGVPRISWPRQLVLPGWKIPDWLMCKPWMVCQCFKV